ncbi:MAG: putative baseplate assembly protein [Deltaproteobacteria bacterium]
MPLSDHIPRLDDRTYDDIVEEALRRIQRYAPEWTDRNESDPGITLIQLFSWMTEMMVFRMNRIPERNYLAFLEMVGIELEPARPATSEVTFGVLPAYAEPIVDIPIATQVAAQDADDEGPIIFETQRSLTALRMTLESVLVRIETGDLDESLVNAEATVGFDAFGRRPVEGNALYLGFRDPSSTPAPFPQVELDLAFFLAGEELAVEAEPCGSRRGPTATTALAWEYWNGRLWKPLAVRADETLGLTRSGHVRLGAPAPGEIALARMGSATDRERHWIRARLERSGLDASPRIVAVRTNTVRVVQEQTIRDEIVAGSDGRPDQEWHLRNVPIVPGSLELDVYEDETAVRWSVREDLLGSGPLDEHVAVDAATGRIRAGDGRRGRIPSANPRRPTSSIVARSYRFGGGARGNVGAGRLNAVLASVPGVDPGRVTNLFAAHGGQDEESIDDAVDRAPQFLKSRERAVTAEDFELLARAAGARRAKALPFAHPKFPGIEVPGVISVIVVPDVEGPAPLPGRDRLARICAHLDKRRLATTELFVVPPCYRKVHVHAEIIAEEGEDFAQIRSEATRALDTYFHPLTGGEGDGWPFGGAIRYGLVLHRLMRQSGVRRVGEVELRFDGEDPVTCADLLLAPGALTESGDHTFDIRYEADGEAGR